MNAKYTTIMVSALLGHPDMRRLFLRDDWVGYPLRKDYDENLNPLRMTNEEAVDTTQYIEVTT